MISELADDFVCPFVIVIGCRFKPYRIFTLVYHPATQFGIEFPVLACGLGIESQHLHVVYKLIKVVFDKLASAFFGFLCPRFIHGFGNAYGFAHSLLRS